MTEQDDRCPPVSHRRRRLCAALGAFACGAGALPAAPAVHTRGRVKLRVLGTHVTLREQIRQRAEQDLGIELIFMPGGNAEVLYQGGARPDSFDLYEQWSNSIRILWSARSIQPIDTRRIALWSEVNDLTKTGRLTPEAPLGQGDAPYRLINVQPDGGLGATPSERISFLPYVHNVDAFGYDTRVVPRGVAYETESWGWLLDPRWHGQVALVNDPTIGLFDAALAVQARGLMTFANIGDISKPELDQLFDILIQCKLDGHFSGFWSEVPESVGMMRDGRAALASMFSPAVAALNEGGIPAVYAAPREGYRAWHGVMCLSANTRGRELDAAYDYMNWWLSGWAGAFVARQGYYISVPERARPLLSPAEWDYWYEGKPAAEDLCGPDGELAVRAGTRRNGGSYWQRFGHVAVWNSVMDSYDYSLPRWHELLLA
ncbi:ABC transporter substrate-binding protein [Thiocystis violascens]|uniref:Spermidine/putrescine-binding periplasmic protein n=1 Tax=Thiocystis violascens (strain ATCC 17096 / DSM 198 / 6111) TaxID=765911 RepID=I3YA15_THIV6|nr:extracellular solute-binding protein [Thiocystis violascens]AFL73833.1 spermidine/putrescine-binding periplasmic protein [Thiocystis violascens DSM 198]